jgi:hypothetical protein
MRRRQMQDVVFLGQAEQLRQHLALVERGPEGLAGFSEVFAEGGARIADRRHVVKLQADVGFRQYPLGVFAVRPFVPRPQNFVPSR